MRHFFYVDIIYIAIIYTCTIYPYCFACYLLFKKHIDTVSLHYVKVLFSVYIVESSFYTEMRLIARHQNGNAVTEGTMHLQNDVALKSKFD